jgi:hypothetical protein
MHTTKCTLTMEDIEFHHNEAKSLVLTDSKATLTRVSFHDNVNNRAIASVNSVLVIDACKFAHMGSTAFVDNGGGGAI